MNKKDTLYLLAQHQPFDEEERNFLAQTIEFVEKNDEFWQRTTMEGHLTGSAWVLSPDRNKALLIHHAKLDRWFQPGGHADATDESLLVTAQREAIEECGIGSIEVLKTSIFDIDVHSIPEKGAEPAHWHYDIRFLFAVSDIADIKVNKTETKGLKWVPLADLRKKNVPSSIRRMAHKLTQ